VVLVRCGDEPGGDVEATEVGEVVFGERSYGAASGRCFLTEG
jgi:hypothetical protein